MESPTAPPDVALYPPGQCLWVDPAAKGAPQLHRVESPGFFEGVRVAPGMFAQHFLGQYASGLRAVYKQGGGRA
jgi:hypothetical protein